MRLRLDSAAFWALFSGVAWWMVGWLMLLPPPLRLAPWTAIRDPSLVQIAVAGALAALGYGAVFALVFAWLEQRWTTA